MEREVLLRRGFKLAFATLAFVAVAAAPLGAQITSGKLTGVVTDAQTGEALAGAQIYIDGTGLGSLSAENGRYFLIHVPPGTYSVVTELIGYQTVRSENVTVLINATYTL
ncbi:MAG: carboxypeptidase-like regulatory domain-containing protein, partial [Candidatus Palauibacterales bacterium]|nr:carboxypeptidase-like regulatory domain-containing protein [Candidatus Palauibacterales bacterium]